MEGKKVKKVSSMSDWIKSERSENNIFVIWYKYILDMNDMR